MDRLRWRVAECSFGFLFAKASDSQLATSDFSALATSQRELLEWMP